MTTATVLNFNKVEAEETTVSVQPSSQTVGQEDVPLPTSPFTINITVQDVEDLYAWQIVLYYNSTILSTREDLIIIPPENVFKGKAFTKSGPYIEVDNKGTYILFGATLYLDPSGVTVTDSRVLCQITFTGQATGTSELNLGITAQQVISDVEVTQDAAAGQNIVYVANAAIFEVGATVKISDNNNPAGEVNQVADVDIVYKKLTLVNSLTNTYTVAAEGRVNEVAEFYAYLLNSDEEEIPSSIVDGSVTVLAPPPVADFTYSPSNPIVGEVVTFDASTSTPNGGDIVGYSWNFGDGNTGTGIIATNAYTTYGTYTVTLTITDSEGLTDTESKPITIRAPPVASFTYSPLTPIVGEVVTFDASASTPNGGTIVSYAWDFESDGTIDATDITTTHAYNTHGTFTVTLTITDSEGLTDTESKPITIRAPPVASFTYSPELPDVLVTVTFDASASYDPDGTIVSYAWDFESDGTIDATDITTTHAYFYEGAYTVKLTVVDDDGLSSTTEKSVAVGRGAIEIEADVGTIHFVGEKAEFYLLVKFLGNPIDATAINAKLYYNGIIVSSFPTKIERVDTGLYRILWDPIPDTASSGTYTVLIQASYFTLKDSTIKSFLISKTLTDWNPLLISIDGIVGTIKNDVDLIKLNLKDINATLTEIIKTAKGDILAYIDTALGPITANLDTINATLTDIIVDSKGEILAEISYYLGTNGTITVELEDIGATLIEIIVDSRGHILAKIDSAIGPVTTTLDAINAKVVAIDGNVATIKTDVDTVKVTLSTVQTTSTTPLYVTSVFSVVAAIIALIVLFILRRKPT